MTRPTNHPTDHHYWEYLIPYYVNRTLTPPERMAFERHLVTCAACRQALEDWHSVAGMVQQEVAVWAQQTPPLSSEVRAQIGISTHGSRSAHAPGTVVVSHSLRGGRQTGQAGRVARRPLQVPLTLVAAAVMIVIFGGLLLYMATNGDDSSPASQAEVNNGVQPTLGLRPTGTPFIEAQESPMFAQPDDLGILDSGGNNSNNAAGAGGAAPDIQAFELPTDSGIGGANTAFCQAMTLTTATVMMYDQPGGDNIVGYLNPGEALEVFQRTVEGWYQLIWSTGYLGGWVRGSEIALNGACNNVLYPTPTGTVSILATPTAVYRGSIGMGYLMMTTEQVGEIATNTRVRISYAWQDNDGWWYNIVAEDEIRQADARTWQLTYAPDVTPGPTPTNVFQYLVGNGDYRFVTREQLGAIPSYTAVRIDAAWYDGVEWNYTIVSQAGASATARLSQIQYPPPEFFVTMTATAQAVIPAATLTATPTATPQIPPAQIQSFTADPNPAEAGVAITLAWETINAASVSVREVKQDGTFGQWYEDLATVGTLVVIAPDTGASPITYVLVVADSLGREITGQITVRVE
ncbi:MAG: zf-HC2 domain-containing protein [Anaerolineae bacterium]|nr:zf-HC2 domain-containing protein [Anaerolineae bacterium]